MDQLVSRRFRVIFRDTLAAPISARLTTVLFLCSLYSISFDMRKEMTKKKAEP